MKNISDKFRYIFVPYLYVSFFCISICSLFNLGFGQTGTNSINENILNFWVPILFPVLPLAIWIWRRLKLLTLERKGPRDLNDFYIFLAWLAIIIPNSIAQNFIHTVVGKCTELSTITELNNKPVTKFYKLLHYHLNKDHVALQITTEVTGKKSNTLTFKVYAAVPIEENEITANLCPKAWLGWENGLSISNRQSQEEKNNLYQNFLKHSQQQFDQIRLEDFRYLRKLGNNDELKNFSVGITAKGFCGVGPYQIFLPEYESFESRGGHQLFWIAAAWIIGACIWFLMLLFPRLKPKELKIFLDKKDRTQGWKKFL